MRQIAIVIRGGRWVVAPLAPSAASDAVASTTIAAMATGNRTFAKFTFFKLDPAWQRRDPEARAEDKREFLAACEDFAQDRSLRAYSTVGTRGDTDLLLLAQSPTLEDIHTFHVVLAPERAGEMDVDPPLLSGDDQALPVLRVRRPPGDLHLGAPLPVRLPVREEARLVPAAASTSASGSWTSTSRSAAATREITINTAYSFGLDDQEFVVSFEADEPGQFLDLVQELRGSESSSYTLRDTPIFTCVAMSVAKALDALDGAATRAPWPSRPAALAPPSALSRLHERPTRNPRQPPARGDRRLRAGGLLRGRAPAEAGARRRRGGHLRPPADALRAGAGGRRARPPEDQVGDPRLREDGGARGLPFLRQRRGRASTSAPPSSPSATTP